MSGWSLLYYWQSRCELVFVLHLILYWFGWFSNDKGCFGPWDTCKSLGYQAEFCIYTYPCGSEGAPVTTEGMWPSSREPPRQAGQVGTCSPGQGCHLPALTCHPLLLQPSRGHSCHTLKDQAQKQWLMVLYSLNPLDSVGVRCCSQFTPDWKLPPV